MTLLTKQRYGLQIWSIKSPEVTILQLLPSFKLVFMIFLSYSHVFLAALMLAKNISVEFSVCRCKNIFKCMLVKYVGGHFSVRSIFTNILLKHSYKFLSPTNIRLQQHTLFANIFYQHHYSRIFCRQFYWISSHKNFSFLVSNKRKLTTDQVSYFSIRNPEQDLSSAKNIMDRRKCNYLFGSILPLSCHK